MERIWDIVNAISKEAEQAMLAKVKSLNTKSVRRRLRKQDLKVSILLQFISKGRELKRLQKIGKEFEDFVLHSHRKRSGCKAFDILAVSTLAGFTSKEGRAVTQYCYTNHTHQGNY